MKTASLIAVVATAGIAVGATRTFDLDSGVDGDYIDNFGVTSLMHDFGSAGKITNISFDITFESHAPSWNSEFAITIDTDSGSVDIFAADYGAYDEPGIFSFSDSIDLSLDTTDGIMFVTFWETFNDLYVEPDSWILGNGGGGGGDPPSNHNIDHVGPGSFLTVTFAPIPAPGTAALLGLGGLVATRRRR